MNLEKKIKALVDWGDIIKSLSEKEDHQIFIETENRNPWFIRRFIKVALHGVGKFLKQDALENWANNYHFGKTKRNVGLILAGNVPLVGFHDLLCVLLSGHKAIINLSHQDNVLIPFLVNELNKIDDKLAGNIQFVDRFADIEAIIATGSDNSARYFNYNYGSLPHIIRKNRTSIAILTGIESRNDLEKLTQDVFLYFGLGCRNVSKLFIPQNYDPGTLTRSLSGYAWINDHQKYNNNYCYQKAVREINKEKIIDGGFYIMAQSNQLVSPIANIYYEYYKNIDDINEKIFLSRDKIQCIISGSSEIPGDSKFGEAQFPEVNDYADNTDTMRFLEILSFN